jgi:hypothetical protein
VIWEEADVSQLGPHGNPLRTNIGKVAALDDAVAAFNPDRADKGKTIIAFVREDSGIA